MKERNNVSKTDFKALDAIPDESIDYSEIPELDDKFFEKAIRIKQKKQSLNVRYDSEIIDYFKNHIGKGYQTLMNAILKTYVHHAKRKEI